MSVHELEQLRQSWSQVSEPNARAHAAVRMRLDAAIQAEGSPIVGAGGVSSWPSRSRSCSGCWRRCLR